ncbi:MAG: threonylcarbamoyl-AMP synthase [Spirochaetaceae bacterium 4572_59]|nr:MAG: threonylcarbamoyl-AMP synthase [Spirochaetaceae bacterium 4572_59]
MIVQNTNENILNAAKIINRGGLVAFPTETVYGLGGDALDPHAVAKIFEAKKRPSFDPLITHIADLESLDRVAKIKNPRVYDIISHFWPGSLTIIVPKRDIIPDLISSGLPTMAVRMPDHATALQLIRESSGALAAPSANPFGFLSPTTAQHVEENLGNRIDLILDGGPCRIGVESTVLDLTKDIPLILRPGGLSIESLREVIEDVEVYNRTTVSPSSPGQLKMHYSPRKALYIVDSADDVSTRSGAGILLFKKGPHTDGFAAEEVLSESGDPVEAAATLFTALHRLDAAEGTNRIYVEKVPLTGLGAAVMDRIYKASKK